jgi:hypothetical protein
MNTESPWAIQPPAPADPDDAGSPLPLRIRKDAVAAVAVAAFGAALGLAVGALWEKTAPPVQAVLSQGSAYLAAPEGKSMIALDGWFAGFAAIAAVLTALAAFLFFRRDGAMGAALGLAGGGIGGAYLATWFGARLGPGRGSILASVHGVPNGGTFNLPYIVRAMGVVWLWPVIALALYLLLMLVFGPSDPVPAEVPVASDDQVWTGWGPEDPAPDGPTAAVEPVVTAEPVATEVPADEPSGERERPQSD